MSEHKNQCDGCQEGLPIVEGMHKAPSTYGWTTCTKDRYQPTTEEELRKKYNKFWGYNMCNQKEFDEIADWWLEQLRLAVEEATHCKKTIPGDGIHGDGICSVKLDCHLHDWRQKDAIAEAVKKERGEIIQDIANNFEDIVCLTDKLNNKSFTTICFKEKRNGAGLKDIITLIRSREQ